MKQKTIMPWWSRKWLELLEMRLGDGYRNMRYRAGKAKAEFLTVEPGAVKSKILEGKQRPCFVKLGWPPISEETWQELIRDMASRAVWGAKLLACAMPEEAGGFFESRGVDLFPRNLDLIESYCSFHGKGAFCKHTAYTHFYFAEAVGQNPFLLFQFRGRGQEALTAALTGGAVAKADAEKKEEATAAQKQPEDGFFWKMRGKVNSASLLAEIPFSSFPADLPDAPYEIKGENLRIYLRRIYDSVRACTPETERLEEHHEK